jgi:peptidoglycan hydrolase CwlO-like protein
MEKRGVLRVVSPFGLGFESYTPAINIQFIFERHVATGFFLFSKPKNRNYLKITFALRRLEKMETKIYAVIVIMLMIGLVGGYFVGSISQQDQAPSFEDELDSKNQQIAGLQTEVQDLEDQLDGKNTQIANLQTEIQTLEEQADTASSQITNLQEEIQTLNSQISTLQSEVQSLNNQINTKNQQIADLEAEVETMRISVEIEEVTWDAAADTVNVTVRNTGGVNVTVGAISLKETSGEIWHTDISTAATGTINAGEAKILMWDGTGLGFDLLPATSYTIQVDYYSNYATQYAGTVPE